MKSRYTRSPLVRAAAAACLLVAPQAQAVVFYCTSSPTFNSTAPTGSLAGSGWQYEGINGSHLGTPIGPHHFLTAAHLNNGVGGTFTYNGVNYTTIASQDFGDLRLFQVSGTFYSYAPLYDAASDGDETGKGGVVIGRGRTRGAEATVDGALRGWFWGSDDSVQRWGENKVSGIASYAVEGDNKLLKFNFDASGAGYTGVNEAHLAQNDSGGAVFIRVDPDMDGKGEWKLAGINYAVSGPYRATPGGADLQVALFDTRGFFDGDNELISGDDPTPSSWYASRISTSLASIKPLLNLPATWKTDANASWSVSSNWANAGQPNAIDAVADFRTAITADRVVNVNFSRTVGTINIDSTHRYTLGGTNTLTFNVSSGSAAINIASGDHTISAPVVVSDPLVFNVIQAASTLTLSGNVSATGQALTKQGPGEVEIKHLRAASLAIDQGRVRVISNGTSAATGKLSTLSIAGGASLDIENNMMAVTSTSIGSWNGSTYTGLTGLVKSGRAGGAWTGPGIRSSAAAGDDRTAVGIAPASQVMGISATQTATWSGQTVDGNTVLLKYTYAGDANLDGKINIDDYGRIDGNVAASGSVFGYYNGDFNFDGKINIDDYGIIDGNINAQGAALVTSDASLALEGVAAVPEPSAVILGLLIPLALRRHRRA